MTDTDTALRARIAALRPWPEGEALIQSLERLADMTLRDPLPKCGLCHQPIMANPSDPATHVGCCMADMSAPMGCSAEAAPLDVERRVLEREYNVAVANGSLIEARYLDRRIKAMEADR